jgi:drug/metabolite transporter (DMT)-like permease
MVFGQFPDKWTWFGSAIIFATGVYVVLREWSKKNQR